MAEQVDAFGTEVTEQAPPKQPVIKDHTTRWAAIISKVLDVQNVLSYMNSAERGMLRYQMEMFDHMIERDPHLGAVLQTRRLALTQAEWSIVPGDENDPRAVKAADMVREDLNSLPSFEDSMQALLDGIAKGIAVQEIIYNDDFSLNDLIEIPTKLLDWQEPELRIMADGIRPTEMIPNKFIRHSPRLRPGPATRRGLMRTLAVYWCISHFAMEDWAGYSEVFGQPLRLGKYGPNTSETDIATLESALVNLGSDAAGVISEDTSIEFPEPRSRASGGSSKTPMADIIDHIEKKMSIAVLGQNLTTQSESGSGTLAGGAQERVMKNITRADGRQLNTTLRRDLFRPLVGFRMGWDIPLPHIKWDLKDKIDQVERGKVFALGQELGVPVSAAQVREELQLLEPADDDDVLEQQPSLGPGMFSTLGTTHSASAALTTTNGAPAGSAMRANGKVAASAADAAKDATEQIFQLLQRWAGEEKSPEALMTRIRLAATDLDDKLAKAGLPMEEFEDLVARASITADFNARTAIRAEREV